MKNFAANKYLFVLILTAVLTACASNASTQLPKNANPVSEAAATPKETSSAAAPDVIIRARFTAVTVKSFRSSV